VMELVEGPTLADRIKAGPIPIDEALRIAKQICEALEYAHERGIVHRDLKPANVKVTSADAVKVLDFGLAKAIEGDPASFDISTSPTLTRMATMQGVLLGTAAYMSPEQAKGKAVDRRADIWAFGCVLYEMLTAKMAFSGETVTDTLAAVVMKDPDWSQLPANTPTRVRVLLQRCLQKDAKQRLRDIGDARISLEEVLSGAPEPIFATAAGARAQLPTWRRALPWALAAAFALALAALAFVYFSVKIPVAAEPVRFDIPMPPQTSFVFASGFHISPNARELAFAGSNPDGTNRLWIRDMGLSQARPLAGTESGADLPFFWTSDSKYLVFQQNGVLKRIEVSSGVVDTLCDVSPAALGGSSNRDGIIIFGLGDRGLMRISANGGPASPLTTLDPSRGEFQHVFPSFLPDGRHFLYLRVSSNLSDSGIYIGSLDASPAKQDSKRLLATTLRVEYVPSSSDPNEGQLLFQTSGGTLMARPFDARSFEFTGDPVPVEEHVGQYINGGEFSASPNGVLVYRAAGASAESQPRWFDRQGKIVGTVGEPDVYNSPALSPDGNRIVAGRGAAEEAALWLFDSSKGTNTRLTFGSGEATDPIWSPDGKRIFFASNSGGISDLYQKLASGAAGEDLLLKSSENKWPSDISHDGRFLLYSSLDPQTKDDIWVLPLQGEQKPFPFLRTPFDELNAHFSPDVRWVAYESYESGRDEVYVRPFDPESSATDASGAGAKWQVSYGGGALPLWSGDGKELYYLTSDAKVMEVDVTESPAFQAGTPKFLFQAPPLADIPSVRPTGKYTLDGKRFLFISATGQGSQAQDQGPFNVVLNWQAALKQQP